MKRLTIVVITVLMLLLSGCSTHWDEFGMNYTGGNAQSGGDLTGLRRSIRDGVECITLSFSNSGKNLPAYRVFFTPPPYRLVVELDHGQMDLMDDVSRYDGLLSRDGRQLYLHIAPCNGVEVVERADEVTVLLKRSKETGKAYYRYSQESMEGLTPTLCADGRHSGWISQPYAAKEEAENAAQEGEWVIALSTGELPEYRLTKEEQAAAAMASLGGIAIRQMASGRRFLCSWNGGTAMLMEEEVTGKLWMSLDGKEETIPTVGEEIGGITWAAGHENAILVLRQGGELSNLYRFDLSSRRWQDLSAMGMGQTVLAAWADGGAVYSSGGGGIFCFDGTDVEQLVKTAVDLPAVANQEGTLYYCDLNKEGEYALFKRSPDGETKQLALARGAVFSRRGQAALFRGEMITGEYPVLAVLDLKNLSETTLLEQGSVMDAAWTEDGSRLYYTVADADGNNALYCYLSATGGIQQLGTIGKGSIDVLGEGLCISQRAGERTILYRYGGK